MKRKSKKSVQVSKQSQNMFRRKEQVFTKSVSQEKYVNQCVVQDVQEETSLWKCQANDMDDKNCQVSRCVHMWPIKPTKKFNNLWSIEPATQSSYKKSVCSDTNCQSTRCCKKKYPVRSVCDDKNCQSTVCSDKNCQTNMQPGTKPSYMCLAKPAIIQSSYKKSLCSDKNCQSTNSYKKKSPVRPMCHERTVNLPDVCICRNQQCHSPSTKR